MAAAVKKGLQVAVTPDATKTLVWPALWLSACSLFLCTCWGLIDIFHQWRASKGFMVDMEACFACCHQMLQRLSSPLPTPLYKPLLR